MFSKSSDKINRDVQSHKERAKNEEARINTKYKTVEKKVWPLATPLPKDSEKVMKDVSTKLIL